jgi:thiol-disulfide isomerase/thioredoxin
MPCGRACKSFQPHWQETAKQYGEQFSFYDVDVTTTRDIIKAQGLKVLPHIHIYNTDGTQVGGAAGPPSR